MENREGIQSGFDERAALDELERVRQEIERYKAKRKELGEQFDEFVRSFKAPPQGSSPRPRPQREPQPQLADTVPAPREDDTAAPFAPAEPPVLPHRGRRKTPALLAGMLTLVAAGGWVTWIVRTRAPRSTAAAPVPAARQVAASHSQIATASAKPPDPSGSELTTTGRVWVRVVVDGERVVERELPANARIPLTAEKTIVIRAGNAGAVRVTLAGRDQGVLGPEGTVVTRTFSLPSRPGETRDR